MLNGLVKKILIKSLKQQTRRHQLVCLVLDETFFLIIVPWLLIFPAHWISQWFPVMNIPSCAVMVAGIFAILAGLFYSLWAVLCQWRQGSGTPSLNAPTQHLVISGPYRLSRNPIQLGSSVYILGLGTLTFSLAAGIIAGSTALILGILYIKAVEEKELRIRFGDAFESYYRQTPFLIPSISSLFGIRRREQRFQTIDQCSRNAMDMQKNNESTDNLPDTLPTKGRVLIQAAYVYDQVQPFVTLGQEARMNRWIAEQIKSSADNKRILDVGCGTGLLTINIAECCPGCAVEGIDASGPMIRVARRKRTRPNCTFQQALAENLPYPDEHFDIITSALFFHHVNQDLKRRCLQEIYRTLKPGGRLIIADMDKPYTMMGWLLSYGAWIIFRQPEIKENMDGVLRKEVQQAGFIDMEDLGRFSGYINVFSARRPL